jgi:hypothetical protein
MPRMQLPHLTHQHFVIPPDEIVVGKARSPNCAIKGGIGTVAGITADRPATASDRNCCQLAKVARHHLHATVSRSVPLNHWLLRSPVGPARNLKTPSSRQVAHPCAGADRTGGLAANSETLIAICSLEEFGIGPVLRRRSSKLVRCGQGFDNEDPPSRLNSLTEGRAILT